MGGAGQLDPGIEVVLLAELGITPVSLTLAEPFLIARIALTESPLTVRVQRTAVLAVVVVVVVVVIVVVTQTAQQQPVLDIPLIWKD